ncbi:hypothetical protein QJS10_CPA07g00552 [Acorus calamus]|uniref:Uncharacterized protein n=1 Tax=Acorus calamus TaxID=4465 RepID=A0AAV9EIQ6_ACOCL|nr:hypothetical protein QJS10_CPA07g00552 [Acorus calamus]
MAISINCCLNVSSPTPSPNPPSIPPSMWRNRCLTTAACVIIGSTAVGFTASAEDLIVTIRSERSSVRWSDQRRCPPWHANSLENVVPENLPRPTARRQVESVSAIDRTAPAVGGGGNVVLGGGQGCYSL